MEKKTVSEEYVEKCFEIIYEMMEQRGYTIIESDEKNITAVDADGNTVIAMILKDIGKINIENAKSIMSFMNTNDVNHAILIRNDVITPSAKDAFSSCLNMQFEFFCFTELQYNITKHQLVPLHEKLSEKEREEYKEKFGLKIPTIKITDPVCRFYNFKKNDVIRIYRKNYPIYRIVK